jgi:arsenate reductase (thioredoxin)
MLHVLFLCVENSARSQVAEAFARFHGAELVEARSAGSRPSGRLDPRVIETMHERGYDMGSHRSKGLAETGLDRWDWAVTMGCGDDCPWVVAANREDWSLPDPRDLTRVELDALRDEIERRVLDLLARLRSDQPTPGSGDCC